MKTKKMKSTKPKCITGLSSVAEYNLLEKATNAYMAHGSGFCLSKMRAALIAIGLLPKKKAAK